MHIINIEGKHLFRLFWITILLSFISWLIALIIEPQGRQLDLFFLRMGDFWADATNTTGLVSCRDPYHNATIGLENAAYPPLAYLLFYFFSKASSIPVGRYLYYCYDPKWTILFVMTLSICLILLYIVCIKQFQGIHSLDVSFLSLAVFFSYPMIYTIERGNILIFVILLVSIYIFYYDSKSNYKKELALVCLAMAIGIKLSPALFGILLFYKKDWKAVLRVTLYGLFFLIIPFLFFEEGIYNLFQMVHNIKLHFMYYSDFYGTGLIASYVKFGKFFIGESFKTEHSIYLAFKIVKTVISLLLLFGAVFFEEKWKTVLNVTIVLLILPSVSGFYCMLYIIPATILFFNSLLEKKQITIDSIIIFICLIMIFFVYRCSISDFFNYNFAIPILSITCGCYSINLLKDIYKKSLKEKVNI